MSETAKELYQKLSAEFTVTGPDGKTYPAHKWRILTASKGGALCIAYIDSNQVKERLNEVLGVDGWDSTLEEMKGSAIICSLTIKTGDGKQTSKSDIGTETEFGKEKGTVSDAIKRAAISFGVGLYLKNMEPVKLNTVKLGVKFIPCTSDNKPLETPDALTSYINQLHPLRAKLTEIFRSLSKEDQEKLTNNFTEIWNILTN